MLIFRKSSSSSSPYSFRIDEHGQVYSVNFILSLSFLFSASSNSFPSFTFVFFFLCVFSVLSISRVIFVVYLDFLFFVSIVVIFPVPTVTSDLALMTSTSDMMKQNNFFFSSSSFVSFSISFFKINLHRCGRTNYLLTYI